MEEQPEDDQTDNKIGEQDQDIVEHPLKLLPHRRKIHAAFLLRGFPSAAHRARPLNGLAWPAVLLILAFLPSRKTLDIPQC